MTNIMSRSFRLVRLSKQFSSVIQLTKTLEVQQDTIDSPENKVAWYDLYHSLLTFFKKIVQFN
jgi:hypothetical protein